jgi:HNH endonuclease
MNGEAVASGVPETIVVVDNRDGSIRWDLDIDLPASAVQRFVDRSNVHFVDVHGDRINFADGNLNLGRTSRLANRAQRRAKQALHATCAIPGCDARFERTKLHHIIFWEHGGTTDLDNLTPICVPHHSLIHTGALNLRVDANGQLIVTTAEGTMTTGPPGHNAA